MTLSDRKDLVNLLEATQGGAAGLTERAGELLALCKKTKAKDLPMELIDRAMAWDSIVFDTRFEIWQKIDDHENGGA